MRKRQIVISSALAAIVVVAGLVYSLFSLNKAKAELAQLEDEKLGLQRRVELLERDKTRLTRQYEESEKAKWKAEQDLKRARRSDTDMLPLPGGTVSVDATQSATPAKETAAPANKR